MSNPNHPRSKGGAGTASTNRLIFVDDNIDQVGGHYFELAALLMQAAKQRGFTPILVPNIDLDVPKNRQSIIHILPTFQTKKMVRWSLGEDGRSNLTRDSLGNPIGGNAVKRLSQKLTDTLDARSKRPQAMIAQWSDDFCLAMETIKPTRQDRLVINTGDDFVLLALANAIEKIKLPGIPIDAVFHFSLSDTDDAKVMDRIGEQTRSAISRIGSDRLFLHATTRPLAKQWKKTGIAKNVRVIPYPTRPRPIRDAAKMVGKPIKAVFAGAPRAEKGRDALCELLDAINNAHLKQGGYQVSLQVPDGRSKSMVPKSLQSAFAHSVAGKNDGPLQVMPENLSTQQYHSWLDTADLGLFLYEPDRYQVRCSGVLLEMMSRGIPVIVPDRCWLADQVRLAGGHRSIGFIYQNRDEIPDLMRQFAKHRPTICQRAIQHASKIQRHHDPTNTLSVMGIEDLAATREAA